MSANAKAGGVRSGGVPPPAPERERRVRGRRRSSGAAKALPSLGAKGKDASKASAAVSQSFSATLPLPRVRAMSPEPSAASPAKSCGALSPSGLNAVSDKLPARKTLATVGRLLPKTTAKMQMHLSPLYFKPFFGCFADLIMKTGVNISPYPCIVGKMSQDYQTLFRQPALQRVLYFVASPLHVGFFHSLPVTPLHQLVNHFPRTELICDKVSLAFLLQTLQKAAPGHYDLLPKTYISWADFQAAEHPPDSLWVMKDDRACGGAGITVTYDVTEDSFRSGLVQEYVQRPLLIASRRFDIRVYVLVLSFNPLRVYIADEGMCHLCVDKYERPERGNIGPPSRHIANVAINMKCENFATGAKDGTSGHIRSFANFDAHLPGDRGRFWERVRTIVMQVLAAVKPYVDAAQDPSAFPEHVRCHEMFGFDFLCTEGPDPAPVLMEANQFPAWIIVGCWYATVKTRLMRHMLALVTAASKYPEAAGKGDMDDAMAKLEDAATATVQNPIFKRMWPANKASSWGHYSAANTELVEATLSRAPSVFAPYVRQWDADRTAALPLQAACSTAPEPPAALPADAPRPTVFTPIPPPPAPDGMPPTSAPRGS
eukprot:TRINITY_DN6668_c0_g1_i1.p2 TRINITY_DN6668_c0_g1~~TRINITY_DN6668_c0_g1_i1.p2  ORF type:complete len:600 (+),score=120.23 TRINITY_DN6668_c0_g1_i1:118-1917(+)